MTGEFYDEKTLLKVLGALLRCGLSTRAAQDAINEMLNAGILFRERVKEEESHGLPLGS